MFLKILNCIETYRLHHELQSSLKWFNISFQILFLYTEQGIRLEVCNTQKQVSETDNFDEKSAIGTGAHILGIWGLENLRSDFVIF